MSNIVPRLALSEMSPELSEALRPRTERLGYLGEFFRCAAHQPEALLSFQAFTEALKRALPDRISEVVALTVAQVTDNAYERVQHERLCLRLGLGEAWIREVLRCDPSRCVVVTSAEKAVQELTLAVLERRGKNCTSEFDALIDAIGYVQAIAVLMLVGRYVTHALFVNCFNLAPPVSSPFEDK